MSAAQIVSLQCGRPADYPADPTSGAKAWRSAIHKTAVPPPVAAGPQGLEGDAVADEVNHGGTDKAVLFYAATHYAHWRASYPESDWSPGAFGENVAVEGLTEADVCVGDVWSAGGVEFEISQPRQPCWKLARRHQIATLVKESARTGFTGWYARVVTPGPLGHDTLTLSRRPRPDWTVERCNRLLFGGDRTRADVLALAAVPELAADWKEALGLPG